jgi:branched-chain amino acid transport system ATP-binding protein
MGLAPVVADKIFEVLTDLNRAGVTILLVEQNAGRALAQSDRGYVLRNGTVAAQGTAAELRADANLQEAYLAADSVDRQS